MMKKLIVWGIIALGTSSYNINGAYFKAQEPDQEERKELSDWAFSVFGIWDLPDDADQIKTLVDRCVTKLNTPESNFVLYMKNKTMSRPTLKQFISNLQNGSFNIQSAQDAMASVTEIYRNNAQRAAETKHLQQADRKQLAEWALNTFGKPFLTQPILSKGIRKTSVNKAAQKLNFEDQMYNLTMCEDVLKNFVHLLLTEQLTTDEARNFMRAKTEPYITREEQKQREGKRLFEGFRTFDQFQRDLEEQARLQQELELKNNIVLWAQQMLDFIHNFGSLNDQTVKEAVTICSDPLGISEPMESLTLSYDSLKKLLDSIVTQSELHLESIREFIITHAIPCQNEKELDKRALAD